MKRRLLKNRFESTYISPSQIVVTDTKPEFENGNLLSGHGALLKCVIRSAKNYAITDLRILSGQNGQKIYVLGHTPYTMILADIQNDLVRIIFYWLIVNTIGCYFIK